MFTFITQDLRVYVSFAWRTVKEYSSDGHILLMLVNVNVTPARSDNYES